MSRMLTDLALCALLGPLLVAGWFAGLIWTALHAGFFWGVRWTEQWSDRPFYRRAAPESRTGEG